MSDCQKLLAAVTLVEEAEVPRRTDREAVSTAMHSISERVQQLTSYCNVILVNDSLNNWYSARADRPPGSSGNAVSLIWCEMGRL